MHKLIVICGPTASGKTGLSVALAKALNTEIINADSRQVYKEMTIGTAVPDDQEREGIRHHLMQTHSILHPINAGRFETEALQCISDVFSRSETAILCGGSGLYIDAVLNGFDELPETDPKKREELNALFEKEGLPALQEQLREADPEYYQQVDLQNPQRIIRALEICASGRKYSETRTGLKKKRDFTVSCFYVDTEKDVLEQRIRERTKKMLEEGLEAEARRLLPHRNLPVLQSVGYAEMFEYLDGMFDLKQTEERINVHTRQYAKRQATWFRKKNCMPVRREDVEKILEMIRAWD